MTIAIAWVRKILDYEQLVMVSDSRLSGDGRTFDGCPKILSLPRTDCAIAFAGDSGYAFSMMLQLSLAIDSFPKMKRRAHELSRVSKHALRVFNTMAGQIRQSVNVSAAQLTEPGAEFVLGCYSWRRKAFEMWSIHWNSGDHTFVAEPPLAVGFSTQAGRFVIRTRRSQRRRAGVSPISLAGDPDSIKLAKERLIAKVSGRKEGSSGFESLDMEPFEVVRDMLRDSGHAESIGGAPQVVKVFQYMRTASFGVFWPDKKTGVPHLHGRPCLDYEALDKQVIDPDTLEEQVFRPTTSDESGTRIGTAGRAR